MWWSINAATVGPVNKSRYSRIALQTHGWAVSTSHGELLKSQSWALNCKQNRWEVFTEALGKYSCRTDIHAKHDCICLKAENLSFTHPHVFHEILPLNTKGDCWMLVFLFFNECEWWPGLLNFKHVNIHMAYEHRMKRSVTFSWISFDLISVH